MSTASGFDFEAAYAAAAPRTLTLREYGAERFTGSPPPVSWLVEGSIPLGVPVLLAAMGDTGKSFVALSVCYHVGVPIPKPAGNLDFNATRKVLGGEVVAHGSAVFITAEDSDAAIHRRLTAIDPFECRRNHPGKLITVALPSAGGPMPFFVRDHNGVLVTDEWRMICDQLIKIKDLKLVSFDPLANFAQVALDTDSADAQFVTSQFGSLAAETGATVLLPHHMRKTSKAPANVAEARQAIRGSSGIVDGVRLAYALWPVDEADGKQVCRALQIPFLLNRVVRGAVVKANESASREIATYVRSDTGLLIDRTAELQHLKPAWDDLQADLIAAVAARALAGLPFNKTGKGGLYEQRERLPSTLRTLGRDRLQNLCQELIDAGKIVQCRASGSNVAQWLDVPGGTFALGSGEFVHGAEIVNFPSERS
jgi:AAA domain